MAVWSNGGLLWIVGCQLFPSLHCLHNAPALLWPQWDQSLLLWGSCCSKSGLCRHMPQWQSRFHSGLHPSPGTPFLHSGLLYSHLCHHLENPFNPGSTQGLLTWASHITMVTMLCGPAMFMYMNPGADASPERDKKLTLFNNIISAFLNPIIYSLRNKDVKRDFLKLTGWDRVSEGGHWSTEGHSQV